MKAVLAVTCASVVLGVVLLPVVLAGGDTSPASCVDGADINAVLATIRAVESGDDYTAQASESTASGAYQFIDSTWGNYQGYPRAVDAPPAIQDARAVEHVTEILDRHRGDIAAIPVVWYIGHLPADGSVTWDIVARPDAGNVLTPRQYQARWLAAYDRPRSGDIEGEAAPVEPGACAGGSIAPLVDGWSVPGPIELIVANPAALRAPHHDYPAWDWIISAGTPVYSIRAGTVTAVRTWHHNWWERGCGPHGGADCDTCGTGVTITDVDRVRWTYCHGGALTATRGEHVVAGQQIMWSGNSGRSGTAHLHVEIRTHDNRRRCPQPLLVRLTEDRTALDPDVLPTTGCTFSAVSALPARH